MSRENNQSQARLCLCPHTLASWMEDEEMQEKELREAELPLSEKAIVKLAELYGTSVSEIKKLLTTK